MKQIGGEQSAVFSLTGAELASLEGRVRDGQIEQPIAVRPEGPGGGLVRFRSVDDAMLAKLAIV